MRAPLRVLASTTLVLESLVVFFAGLVAKDLSEVPPGTALAVCGGLALTCLVTTGLLRYRAGYLLGSVLQVAILATGLLVPVMFFLGAIFGILWTVALYQGARIERERAAWRA